MYTFEMKSLQKMKATIAEEAKIAGVGIHSGGNAVITLRPSDAGEIVFYLERHDNFPVRPDVHRVESLYSSILGRGERKIHTIEHLMAVLFVLGVDSLDIFVDGEEIPICDGSGLAFVEAVLDCGRRILDMKRKTMEIISPFSVEDGDSFVSVEPCGDFRICYTIDFEHPAIRKQSYETKIDEQVFTKEIAPARTFGFLKDVESLRRRGLSLGGSLDNVLVLDESRVMNEPLRFKNEFVRHKVLDFIGDLSLLGFPVAGKFTAYKAGHRLHLSAVRFLFDNPSCYRLR